MTGFEPLAAAATAGLTALVTEIIKDQGTSVLTRLFNWDVSKELQQNLFNASIKYIQNYAKRHGSLKVLGMREPVSLESIYTTVQVLDCEDRSFASVEELEKSFREAQARRLRFIGDSRKEGLAIANEKQYLMVLGAPGCGKSTFLRKMGIEALKGRQGGFKKHRCIPVLLELKQFNEPKVDIKKLIATEFQICGFPNAEPFTQKALEQGKLLILLDGLDEVPTANRDVVIETIQDFVDQYDKNRYITSCRIAAYLYNFRRFIDVTIAEFDDDQIRQFINNWFQSETDKQSGTAKRCWEILQQAENAAAKELAHTPLLLTFLCLVYDRSQTFSNNRSTLYRKALRILLEEWAAEKRIMHQEIYQGLNTELEEVLLSEIACGSFDADRLFLSQAELVEQIKTFLANNLNAPKHLSGETVLKAIAEQQGILVERAEDIYSFSHLTLQEYLTARYIVDHRQIQPLVTQHLRDPRWREVFLLVSGSMVIGKGADDLLQAMSQAIQTYAAGIPRLQALLQWTNEMTAPSTSTHEAVAKRAIVLQFALALDPARALARSLDPARALARSLDPDLARFLTPDLDLDPDLDLARALALDLDLARALALALFLSRDRDLARDLTPGLIVTLAPDLALALSLALARVRDLIDSRVELFVGVDLLALVDQLESLRSAMPKQAAPPAEHQHFADRLLHIYCDTFKLNPALLQSIQDEQNTINTYFEKNAINTYLEMNYLMVQCQQEASRVSPQTWAGILATMLFPDGGNG